MRDASTYRAARRNAVRRNAYDMPLGKFWRWTAETTRRNDGFMLGWHQSMEPSPMGSGVPKPKSAVLTDLAAAAE